MSRLHIVAATVLSCVFPCVASQASPMNWRVDPKNSVIGFVGTQTGQQFSGQFTSYTASIDFDPAAPTAGHALVVIKTCSAHTGDTQRDEAMPGADWFNCAAMPDATFKADSFRSLGANKFEADGTLSIRGISKPLTLPFTFIPTGNKAVVTGSVDILRTDFGVGQNAWSSGQWVALKVTVTIKLSATKE
jgi:polyisoprenoid-binding protein YceI